jgi:DNA-binding beta-propeller fold protein YncE
MSRAALKQTISIANSFVGAHSARPVTGSLSAGGASNDVKLFAAAQTDRCGGPVRFRSPGRRQGVVVDPDGARLYVALNMTHKSRNRHGLQRRRSSCAGRHLSVHDLMSADGAKAYVSNWGGKVPDVNDFY